MTLATLPSPLTIWNADEGVVAPAAVVTTGVLDLSKFLNGRVDGSVNTDAAGTLVMTQARVPGELALSFTIPADGAQPGIQHPFLIALFWPFVTFTWTQGGAPGTFLRAQVVAKPLF